MRHTLALHLAACLLGCSLQAATVAYYEFDGTGTAGVGSTITDSSGNAYHGTVTGGDLVYGDDPLVGRYLHFNADGPALGGLGNRVVVSGAAGFLFTPDQGYTIEVVFRTTQNSSATNGVLVSKGCDVSNPDSQWWLRHQGSGQIRANIEGLDNTTEDNATSAAGVAYNDGQWHSLAAVFDGVQYPTRLDVYVDGILKGSDVNIGTLGVIGGTDDDPVVFGEFASLTANRSFDGDIAAIRFSDAALTPAEFLRAGKTYFTDVNPTNGASFLPASTIASFMVHSPMIGVVTTNIHAVLNGVDVSSQLSFSGTDFQRTVTLPTLSANLVYRMEISVTDLAANVVSQTTTFNTFESDLLFVEAEDYDFESGQFIDNPPLSSFSGPNSYLDRYGVEGVDYHQTNTPAATLYRIGDQVGTAISTDSLRQEYVDAQLVDPGVADYMTRDHANTEWLNYTRTFPPHTYRVYVRVAKGGTVPIVMQLEQVTSGSTTPNQTLAPIGFFRRLPTLAATDYDFIPLTDALGQEVAVPLSGVTALRLTMVSGTAGMNFNYLLFVPSSAGQPPFLAGVSPASGAGNELPNAAIQATIRNGDTTVVAGTIQLRLDDVGVTPAVAAALYGATVSYVPSVMSTGLHTAKVIFTDSAATSITNQWQFYVANQAVRGYWVFDEQAVGGVSSTNAGSILDASGNRRNGTANSDAMPYVTGSINYGNTRALRFSSSTDRVVVPDASGNFTFAGSFTFEAVIRTTNSSSTTAALLAKNGTGDGEGEYWWRIPGASGGKQRIGLNNQTFVGGTNTLTDGAWHHVAAVYDQFAGEVRLYADYVLEGIATEVAFDKPVGRPANLHIGSFIDGGSEFDGEVDFIRISEGALTTDQFEQRTVPLGPIAKTLLPAADARNVSPKPTIEAVLQNRDLAVEVATLQLFVDGVNVTASATKSENSTGATISYTPGAGLATGAHTAMTTFSDNGSPASAHTNTWSFTVIRAIPVLGLYQFNEKSAGETADITTNAIPDASGNARPATASAELPYVAGSPDYGDTTALQFTVGGGHVAVPDPAGVFNFTPAQSVTFEAIIRTVNIGESSVGAIAVKQGTDPGEWWWRINAAGTQQFWVNDGSGSRNVAGSTVLNDGLWHHVAAVYDGVKQELRVYVDYQTDGTAAAVYTSESSIIGNAKDLWIGAFQAGTRQFDGDIDVVRLTGEALDPSWFIPLGGVVASPTSVTLTDAAVANGSISFRFATQAGFSYVVQATDALGGAWGDVETLSGDGSTKTVGYTLSGSHRFFRVEAQSN